MTSCVWNGSLLVASCVLVLGCGGDSACEPPPPIEEMILASFVDTNYDGVVELTDGIDLDTGMPVDSDQNGQADPPDGITDQLDIDGDGSPDSVDYDLDGTWDNRFYLVDDHEWIPDGDSYDDYEDYAVDGTGRPVVTIPRGRTPVAGDCPADGIETGPLDLEPPTGSSRRFTDYVPSSYCRRGNLEVRTCKE